MKTQWNQRALDAALLRAFDIDIGPVRMAVMVLTESTQYWDRSAPFGNPFHSPWYGMQHDMQERRGILPPDALRDSAFLLSEITL